jgi:DNA-nicking Smr family endonuclease
VLVITGKGKPDGDAPSSGGGLFARSRGVLRQVVPMWLAAAELRPHVVGFTTAHARHGGNGALYVQVRRKER